MAGFRDNDFNESQIRGLDLVIKSIGKEYTFINGWLFADDYLNYNTTLYINIYIDIFTTADYLGFEVDEFYKERGYLITSPTLSPFIKSKELTRDESFDVTYKLKQDITKMLNNVYNYLPNKYKIFWGFDGDTVKYTVELVIDKFIHKKD
jgi:hypothetical protein